MTTLLRRLILSLVLGPLSLLTGCSDPTPTDQGTQKSRAPIEDQLQTAQQVFSGSPDRATCSTTLRQLSSYLADHKDKRPPALTAEQKDLLVNRFYLEPDELKEVENASFTLLDAAHVEFCLLLRDAMRAEELAKLTPAEQAAVGFAWVMRQVRPSEQGRSPPFPPEFVLRRGVANDEERARVVLAVFHQLDIPGCLLTTPHASAPWACGALVEVGGEKQVLVFDHRLGLPLPGSKGAADGDLARAFRLALPVAGVADGQQIATLAELRKKPELLQALTVDKAPAYDVGAEQVKETVVRLAPPLSALAPRMRLLQSGLLHDPIGARLGVDAAELIRQFGSAAGVEGGADSVRAWEGSANVLRRFMSEAAGGTDKDQTQQRLALSMVVPWNALPPKLDDKDLGEAHQLVKQHFAQQFLNFQLEANNPRDLVLRGRYKEASDQIVQLLNNLTIQKAMIQSEPDLDEKVEAWKKNLLEVFGGALREQGDDRKPGGAEAAEKKRRAFEEGLPVLSLMLEGGTAEPREAMARYQQALCMHERAERIQTKADDLVRARVPAADIKEAQKNAEDAWKEADGWWNTCIENHLSDLSSIHARLLRARAEEQLGQADAVRSLLKDFPPGISPYQKLARLYLLQRVRG